MQTEAKKGNEMLWHLTAVIVVLIWGATFINTKLISQKGMRPEEIYLVRCLLAYVGCCLLSHGKLFCDRIKDEAIMLVLGIAGGSLYFTTQNIAIEMSYTTNVSFIICTSPLLTALIGSLFIKGEKATKALIAGSLIALAGTVTIIFNGRMMHLNPEGDMLAIIAAASWSVYCIILRKISDRYDARFITRKVFFYGGLTTLPLFVIKPWSFPLEGFKDPVVWGNLLFLGLIASFACFVLWSAVIQRLGAIKGSNYVYLNPVSTVIVSALVLNEPMTWLAYVGSALILAGVYLANRRVAGKG